MALRDATNSPVLTPLSGEEDFSIAAPMTAAVDYVDRPEVEARVTLIGQVGDIPDVRVGLDEIIQKGCQSRDVFRATRFYQDPSAFCQGSGGADFDDSLVDMCTERQHDSYCDMLAAVQKWGTGERHEFFGGINGREIDPARLAEDFGSDFLSEVEDDLLLS